MEEQKSTNAVKLLEEKFELLDSIQEVCQVNHRHFDRFCALVSERYIQKPTPKAQLTLRILPLIDEDGLHLDALSRTMDTFQDLANSREKVFHKAIKIGAIITVYCTLSFQTSADVLEIFCPIDRLQLNLEKLDDPPAFHQRYS